MMDSRTIQYLVGPKTLGDKAGWKPCFFDTVVRSFGLLDLAWEIR